VTGMAMGLAMPGASLGVPPLAPDATDKDKGKGGNGGKGEKVKYLTVTMTEVFVTN